MYGDLCDERQDRTACSNDFSKCYKSWPAIDPNKWESTRAKCRLIVEQADLDSYTYGDLSKNQEAGTCGTDCDGRCRWSWPISDALKWKSDSLMARCMPEGT